MNMWYVAWLAALGFEALVIWTSIVRLYEHPFFRWLMVGLALAATTITTVATFSSDWRLWLVVGFISLYRLINLVRLGMRRLQVDRLWRQSTSAFTMLFLFQLIALGLAMFGMASGFDTLLALIVAIQVLTAAVLLRSSFLTWRRTSFPTDVPFLSDSELPSISVLVPARNETDALMQCLQTLTDSTYPKMEIIVLDDCSSNPRTADIIKQYAHDGVRFIKGSQPEERWLAKNHAYNQLVENSNGEYLVFCGVDVQMAPDALRRLVSFAVSAKRDMVSVMPQRHINARRGLAILQTMRYYWELAFPRRLFKRPPVLSTAWLVHREALESYGGFPSVAQAITPEAYFAKKAVIANAYSFIRSDEDLVLLSTKTHDEQYATTVRIRYPQIHRRLELVCLVTLFQLAIFVGPFIGLALAQLTPNPLVYILAWLVSIASLTATYMIASVYTRLSEPLIGLATPLVGYVTDIVMLHISMFKYEFSNVYWKGRNVCVPVMHVIPRLPKLPD
jgi:glycosyltransferase involved in cell wall biosynthesis